MSKLLEFKAWCNGKAYPVPNAYALNDKTRTICISTKGTILGRFHFDVFNYIKAKKFIQYLVKPLSVGSDGNN
ncbi:MAG: hypothetical protein E2O29_01805 [Deltaproteobacteria bacterium]|nr:MAG: hypothetical protein E2O29_01805 [Deltaproteobacteria bacterium]